MESTVKIEKRTVIIEYNPTKGKVNIMDIANRRHIGTIFGVSKVEYADGVSDSFSGRFGLYVIKCGDSGVSAYIWEAELKIVDN